MAAVRALCVVHPGHPAASARPVPRTHSDAASTPECQSKGPELFPVRWLVKFELLRASYDTVVCRLQLVRRYGDGRALRPPVRASTHRYDRLDRLWDYMLGGVGLHCLRSSHQSATCDSELSQPPLRFRKAYTLTLVT